MDTVKRSPFKQENPPGFDAWRALPGSLDPSQLSNLYQRFPCESNHRWNLAVSNGSKSVHPMGHPMSHSTHIGFNLPPAGIMPMAGSVN